MFLELALDHFPQGAGAFIRSLVRGLEHLEIVGQVLELLARSRQVLDLPRDDQRVLMLSLQPGLDDQRVGLRRGPPEIVRL